MDVLLISANTERLNMVTLPLGLGLVAAATRRAGHRVEFLDLLSAADPTAAIREAIERVRPDVIGISIRNIDDQSSAAPRFLLAQARPVVDACRSCTGAPVVLGGAGYSIFPRAALEFLGADFGIRGDGEAAFPALLERLGRGEDPRGIPGLYVAGEDLDRGRAVAPDLDDLPLWDDALSGCADPADPTLWVPVQSTRGCPNDCSYCSTASIQGRALRCRSPREVAATVSRLSASGWRRFYFVDNSFNLPESHAYEMCAALEPLGVEWRCILYPHGVTEGLVDALARAGCIEVSLGFESGCVTVLRQMNKRFTPDEILQVSGWLKARGIRRFGFLLLGGPGETRESVEESLAFARQVAPDLLRITVGLRIYPGTALARQAVAEGVLDPADDLLQPRFYLAPGLDPWIRQRVAEAFPDAMR